MAKTKSTATTQFRLALILLALLIPGAAGAASPMLAAGGPTSIPIGALEFCQNRPTECGPNRQVMEEMTLTQKRWTELLGVNTYFNQTIVPITDQQLYHTAEFWTYPNGYGDCEDIALAKRRDLISKGWPASTLLMTVVKQADGEGHAVLLVRTDRGDLVLDNQDGRINLWSDTPYHFLKRQSQANSGDWVDLVDDRPVMMATVAH